MRFFLLGPLEVWHDGRMLPLGGPQRRDLLAVLLLNANRVVATDRLIDLLWGEQPPPTARSLLQGCVAQLRRTLHHGDWRPLVTAAPGYLLRVGAGELDLDRFEELAATASRDTEAGRLVAAAAARYQALSLWRGDPLDGINLEICRVEADRLTERRLAVLEERIDVDLRLGRLLGLVAELQGHVRAYPFRERLWAQLMVALQLADRQADALAAYQEVRRLLVDQLGVDPGGLLRRLEHAVLTGTDVLAEYARLRGFGGPTPDAIGVGSREAPVESAGLPTPAQLPAPVPAFVGRVEQLNALDDLLTGEGISMIVGGAGVGKTALAVHWAHRVRDKFPDGQLYLDLRGWAPGSPVQPLAALTGFLPALGVPTDRVPVETEAATALYRSRLAGRRMLILLDNVRDAEQVRPLLPGDPHCRVLITSRDRLSGLVAREGARRLTLPELTPGEAAALLASMIGPARIAAEPAAAGDLAGACAHLPLALRIAAANITDRPHRRIADHVADLTGGAGLTGLAISGDDRVAVRPAFELTYRTLPDRARRMFRLLGLAAGPDILLDAAAALAGVSRAEAADTVDRLAAAHLVHQPTPDRIAAHDLICRYAGELADGEESGADRTAATDRLYRWYAATVDAAAAHLYPELLRATDPGTAAADGLSFPDSAAALDWLDAARPNLVAAIVHAAAHGPYRVAWQLADALRGYFWLRMHALDWLTVAEAGRVAAEADKDLRGQAAAQLSLGDAHGRQSRYQLAIEHYREALRFDRLAGWTDGESASLGNLGNVHWWSGQLAEAAERYQEALLLAQRTGRLAGQSANLSNLGAVYWQLGQLARAADHHTRSLAIARQLGSPFGQAVDLCNLGALHLELGHPQEALRHLAAGLALHQQIGDRSGMAEALRTIAEVHRDTGDHEQALSYARRADALAEETGNPRYRADTRNTLGRIHLRLGAPATAIECHATALALSRGSDSRHPELAALIGLADGWRESGRPDRAVRFATEAVGLAELTGYQVLAGHAYLALAAAEIAADRPDRAVESARRALAVHGRTGHRLGRARGHLVLGRAVALLAAGPDPTGEPAGKRGGGAAGGAAVEHWRRALAIFAEFEAAETAEVRRLLAGGTGPASGSGGRSRRVSRLPA
ncbi:BTAD domain-containing putative transcriptional regulator [Solwaraspora sp. WMMD1047]|uniref:AfsR/SARP family transcriptional regulator n=1 Tax=Solwaraspora sp. WMMD1047 TaxID=3016102 RepID=UPI002416576D|nr:BTAD domain-containing putative transcriptional regulator [Solwaraspora sp. WMMD1047]MDG4834698.1 BTAD domain-containing putative transcriptional regulator [Solwaraspora sp. WMMD1047]